MRLIASRRAAVARALGRNPYSPALLLERALLAWCAGDWAEVDRVLVILRAFSPGSGALAALQRTAAARPTAIRVEKCYAIGVPPARLPEFHAAIAGTRTVLAPFAPKRAVVAITMGEQWHSTATVELPGTAIVYLGSARTGRGELVATLAHELTHAWAASGCRFLDEGLAFFVQHQVAPGCAHPAPWREILSWEATNGARDLRPLLALPRDAGPLFEPYAESDKMLQDWYCRATKLVAAIVERHTMVALPPLFDALRAAEPEQMPDMLAVRLGLVLRPEMVQPMAAGRVRQIVTEGLMQARIRRDPLYARSQIGPMRALHAAEPSRENARLLAQLLLAEFVATIAMSSAPRPLSLVEAGLLAADLEAGEHRADAHLVRGLAAQARLLTSDLAIYRARWSVAARRHLEAAFAAAPRDPEVLLALARQELNTPDRFGGDYRRGAAFLTVLDEHAGYAEEVAATRRFHASRLAAAA